MKKIWLNLLILCTCFLNVSIAHAVETPARNITVVPSMFINCLGVEDTNVQTALNDIDVCFGHIGTGTVTSVGTTAPITGGPITTTGTIGITQAGSSINGYLSSTDWNTFNGKQASGNYVTALTGDGTASGPGSAAFTLATVNTNTGSWGSSTAIPNFTVDGKGLVTAAGTNVVIAPAGTLTGTALASNVVTSSLTTVGTIGTGTWQGTPITYLYGGSGQVTAPSNDLLVGNGTGWTLTAVGSCSGATNALTFNTGTGAFGCNTISGGVTSVSNSDGTLTISPTTGAVVASRPAITGDVSVPATSNAATLATVNSSPGSFTYASLTVNGKGLVTAASSGTSPITSLLPITLASPNVGIGSISPGQVLDVQGTIRTTGFQLSTGPTSGYVLTTNNAGIGTWAPASGGGSSTNWANSGTDVTLTGGNVGIGTNLTSTSALTVMNGNVGIGTWVPSTLLQVNGNTDIEGTNSLYFGNDTNSSIVASASSTADLKVVTNTHANATITTFTNSGTYTPTFTGTITVLVIAAGGGGGGSNGGGGGAGGYIYNTSYSVTNGVGITVTVGTGGAGGNGGTGAVGTSGGNSVFGSLTAVGGGAGGGYGSGNGLNGGSGGGGSGAPSNTGGTGTSGQGYAGGNGSNGSGYSGGGGGATGVGGNANSGVGGTGYASSISGTSYTYSCGGGGNAGQAAGCSNAGAGGGNNATGYGSGGGGSTGSATGGNGYQGVVIVSASPASVETARFTTNGNMGIGSINPGTSLDVQGTVRAIAFSGIGIVPSGSAFQVPYYASAGATLSGSSNITATGTNVGIGSVSPGQILDVQGTVRSTGFTLTGNNAASGFILQTNGALGIGTWVPEPSGAGGGTPGGGLNAVQYNSPVGTFSGNNAVLSVNGTNVGIGTTNGTTGILDVRGTLSVGTGTTGGVIKISDVASTPEIQSSGNLYLTAAMGSNIFTNGAGSVVINGSSANGVAQFQVDGNATIFGNVGIGTNSPFGGGLIILPTITGNVGIGSLTPGQTLDVQGTIRASTGFAVGTNIGVSGTGTTSCLCKTFTNGICTVIGTCT